MFDNRLILFDDKGAYWYSRNLPKSANLDCKRTCCTSMPGAVTVAIDNWGGGLTDDNVWLLISHPSAELSPIDLPLSIIDSVLFSSDGSEIENIYTKINIKIKMCPHKLIAKRVLLRMCLICHILLFACHLHEIANACACLRMFTSHAFRGFTYTFALATVSKYSGKGRIKTLTWKPKNWLFSDRKVELFSYWRTASTVISKKNMFLIHANISHGQMRYMPHSYAYYGIDNIP